MAPSILSIVKRDVNVKEELAPFLTTVPSVIDSPEEKVEDTANALAGSGGGPTNNVAEKAVQQIVAKSTETGNEILNVKNIM